MIDANAEDAGSIERAIAEASDETLQRIWQEGIESGDAGALDFEVLKAEAHRSRVNPR